MRILTSLIALTYLTHAIPAWSKINKVEYKNAIEFIKANHIDCDWEYVSNEAYTDSNNIYVLSENLSLIGILCSQGSPNSSHVWLFMIANTTKKYELITFAYPIIDFTYENKISGISSKNRISGSFFNQTDGIIYSNYNEAAGDYSETALYKLDYKADFSIRRFLLTSFTADTNKDNLKENNITLTFQE